MNESTSSKRRNLTRCLLLCAAGVLALAAQSATERTVEQKDRSFSVQEITIKPGETVVFKNVDEVTHNVFSTSKVNPFVIKTQKPGESTPVEFKDEGVTEVRCAIHPTMKLMVNVKK